MPLVRKPAEESPDRHQGAIDGGDGFLLLPPQVIPKVRHVPGRDSLDGNASWFAAANQEANFLTSWL